MTLSDMQRQLATIQQQNVHRDETLCWLEKEIKACKRPTDQVDALETPKSKKKVVNPTWDQCKNTYIGKILQKCNTHIILIGLCVQSLCFL